MNRDNYYKMLKEEAEQKKREAFIVILNPLAKYSTKQLKDELNRRKKEGAE